MIAVEKVEAPADLRWPDVLTLEETAERLRISRPTLLELAARGEIPCQRVGKQWRFHRDAVLAWLAGERRVSHSNRRKAS